MINVLLVDDHDLFCSGIQSLLNAVNGISVIGVASCGEQALLFTEQLFPDVILMDVNMPGMGGVEACRRILQAHPSVKVIAVSAYNDGVIPNQLLKLGAMGFLSKKTSGDEMVLAIQKVMAGEPYLCKDAVRSLKASSQPLENSPFAQLSARETEVARLILNGQSIQQIAKILDVKDKTVNTYRYRLYAKLNIKNDVELTRLAVSSNYADSGLILTDLKTNNPLQH